MKSKGKISGMLMFAYLFPLSASAASIYDVPEKVEVNQMEIPRVVELYSPQCPHCRKMAPVYTSVATKCNKNVHFYKVNITTPDGMNAANSIAPNVSGVPTFVFVDKAGIMEEPKSGGMTEVELRAKVDQLM